MKLKSLLLGSAAALALTSGALAADPRVSFVSLDVCDAYGISGLTIASDDTCLRISGEVEYTFAYGGFSVGGGDIDHGVFESTIDWNVQFEATTQTDAGAARAVVRFVDASLVGGVELDPVTGEAIVGLVDAVAVDRAFVSFGDTTVITAGLAGSLFSARDNQHILSAVPHARAASASHSIQVTHDLGNGWDIAGGFEALNLDGLAGVRVGYSGSGVEGRLGVVIRNLFPVIEASVDADVRVFGDIAFDLGAASIFAEFNAGTTGADALLTGEFDLDIATLRAGVGVTAFNDYNDAAFRAGAGVTFALTDTIDLDLEVIYNDEVTKMEDYYLGWFNDAVYGTLTLSSAFTENLTGEAWVSVGAVVDGPDVTDFGAGLGVSYNPGGGFELSSGVGVTGTSTDLFGYAVHFSASKSF